MGDSEAIRYIRRRQCRPTSTMPFLLAYGGRREAARARQAHTQTVFGKAPSDDELGRVKAAFESLQASAAEQPLMPFAREEVTTHVQERARLRKSSGISGLSAEFLHAMILIDVGVSLLVEHCNSIFSSKLVPESYLQAFMCLIPKEALIKVPKHYRPICLLESFNKLLTGMLYRRLLSVWPMPRCQLGALPGAQCVECLWLAQSLLYSEHKSGLHSLWVLLDIKQAFDSLSRWAVIDFLLTHTPPNLHHEALLLWHPLQCTMQFAWEDNEWAVPGLCGVQQGAPPSAGIFSIILGLMLQALFEDWAHKQVRTHHLWADGRPCYGWAYVDDAILGFQRWDDLGHCLQSLIDSLKTLGLEVNFDKTVIVVPDHLWEEGRRFLARQPDNAVGLCQWKSEGVYLRKPFRRFAGSCNISHWVLAACERAAHAGWEAVAPVLRQCSWEHGLKPYMLVNRYVMSKFSWFLMMLEPLTHCIQQLDQLQTTFFILGARLFLPSCNKHDAAVAMHRLRRRCIGILLHLEPHLRWLHSAMRRRWHYLGHLLRKGPEAPVILLLKAAMLQDVRQAVPAPWNTIYTWAIQQFRVLGWVADDAKPGLPELCALAADREVWRDAWERLSPHYCKTFVAEHACVWAHPRHAFTASAPWLKCIALVLSAGQGHLVWLQDVEGVCMAG